MDKIEALVPAELSKFDGFPKLPKTYKARSESRGFFTIFVFFVAFIMLLNDFSEFIWGWPDQEFTVDLDPANELSVNVDMTVAMPCRYLSVDLRDAMGDRLFLSGRGLRRDGTLFDTNQAQAMRRHASKQASTRQIVAQSRKSRGFFDGILNRGYSEDGFKPTYNHVKDGSACRVWGTVKTKKVTANLHITTAGHGYQGRDHTAHELMNLTHMIEEFSFGPYFPEIVQPLDLSYEYTRDPFVAYQYYLHVVPTTYVAPRSSPVRTNQYSVTHYKRTMEHGEGTPGIFFKFDLDPMALTIHQRTTSFLDLLIRVIGVFGGVFVCMGYALRAGSKAVEVVAGSDEGQGLVAAESSSVKLRSQLSGGSLRERKARPASGWGFDGDGGYGSQVSSPMPPPSRASNYPASPFSGGFANPAPSPYFATTPAFGPPPTAGLRSPPQYASAPPPSSAALSPPPPSNGAGGQYQPPSTPGAGYASFPTAPTPPTNIGPPPKRATGRKDD